MLEFCYRKKTRQKDNKGEGIMSEKKVKMGNIEKEKEITEIQDYLLKLIVKIKNIKALKFVAKYLEAVEYKKTDY